MSITSEGMTPADIAAVTGNNRNDGGFGDGSGAWWLLVLFLFAANNGWNNGGWGGNGGNNGAIPYIGTNADIQRGFDQLQPDRHFAECDYTVTDRRNAGL